MAKITNLIKQFFTGRKVEETYVTKIPEEWLEKKKSESYIQGILKRMQFLEKQVRDYQKKDDSKKQRKEEEKELKELALDVQKEKTFETKAKKAGTIYYQLKGIPLRKLPTLYSKRNKPLGKFRGLIQFSTEDGLTVWSPVVRLPGQGIKKLNVTSMSPNSFFRGELNIPEQMRSGKIDTNIDFTHSGRLKVYDRDYIEREMAQMKFGKEVPIKIINMSEVDKQDYERQIESIKDELNQALVENSDMKSLLSKYEIERNKAQGQQVHLAKERDMYTAWGEEANQKMATMAESTARASSSSQGLLIRAEQSQRAVSDFQEINHELRERNKMLESQDQREILREEVTNEIMRGVQIQKEANRPEKVIAVPEKEAKKEEEKK